MKGRKVVFTKKKFGNAKAGIEEEEEEEECEVESLLNVPGAVAGAVVEADNVLGTGTT